ncbi:hypothetical protein F4861DRAFT_546444 [Xylaria intraflava]|nr:hypothetical protein F4861DRAFT_546444 [Xylaria intraflava]
MPGKGGEGSRRGGNGGDGKKNKKKKNAAQNPEKDRKHSRRDAQGEESRGSRSAPQDNSGALVPASSAGYSGEYYSGSSSEFAQDPGSQGYYYGSSGGYAQEPDSQGYYYEPPGNYQPAPAYGMATTSNWPAMAPYQPAIVPMSNVSLRHVGRMAAHIRNMAIQDPGNLNPAAQGDYRLGGHQDLAPPPVDDGSLGYPQGPPMGFVEEDAVESSDEEGKDGKDGKEGEGRQE